MQAARECIELLDHRAAVGPITASQLCRLPADTGEDVRHGAAAVAAAPAVDERAPVTRLVGEGAFQMVRDVARHQRCTAPPRLER